MKPVIEVFKPAPLFSGSPAVSEFHLFEFISPRGEGVPELRKLDFRHTECLKSFHRLSVFVIYLSVFFLFLDEIGINMNTELILPCAAHFIPNAQLTNEIWVFQFWIDSNHSVRVFSRV